MFPLSGRRARPVPFLLRIAVTLLLAGVALLAIGGAVGATAAAPRIDILELHGVLDRPLAAFARDVLAEAHAAGSELVVINLDSPGALGTAATDVAAAVDASDVPVAVWVGPPGAHATGGAYLVAAAAHLTGVAPGVVLGAVAPADLGDPDAPAASAEGLLVAYAERRGHDLDFARAAPQGAAIAVLPEGEALGEQAEIPPGVDLDDIRPVDERDLSGLADVVALSLPDFLRDLDRQQLVIAGTPRLLELDPTTVAVRYHNPGLVRRVLHAVTSPTLAYLLLIAGALALAFELFQPGFGVAGFSGLPVLALGLYGVWVLPANWLAVALLGVGLALLAVDLARGGLGLVTAAGATSLVAGSLLLFRGPPPMVLPGWVIALVVGLSVLFFVVIMTTVLRAQGQHLPVPPAELRGHIGVVRSVLNPEGHVFVNGALWRARAPEDVGKVRTGTRVRVVDVAENATLEVEVAPEEEPSATA